MSSLFLVPRRSEETAVLSFPFLSSSETPMASLGFPTIPLSSPATSALPVGRQAPFFFFSSLRVRTLQRALDAASRSRGVPRIGGSRHHRRFLPTSAAGQSQEAQKRESMVPPYNVLITGSTKGIGEVVTTNTLGLMICCREAINMMLIQPRGGHIFNMDGAGSDGRPTPRFAAYGATKRSVVHLTKSLQAELQMHEVKNVMVHNLSPGMVTTDLLMSGANTKQAKFFINILAEPPEVVADFLVRCIRAIPIKGSKKPTYIRFLTGLKAYSQIFSRIAFGTRRNRYIIED